MRRKPQSSTAKVWHGGRRRYFSKNAAAEGEARFLLKRILARDKDYLSEPEFKARVKEIKEKVLEKWKPKPPVNLKLPGI